MSNSMNWLLIQKRKFWQLSFVEEAVHALVWTVFNTAVQHGFSHSFISFTDCSVVAVFNTKVKHSFSHLFISFKDCRVGKSTEKLLIQFLLAGESDPLKRRC